MNEEKKSKTKPNNYYVWSSDQCKEKKTHKIMHMKRVAVCINLHTLVERRMIIIIIVLSRRRTRLVHVSGQLC